MSSEVGRVADFPPNFGFLLPFEPLPVAYGTGAEAAVYIDPNAVKCRQFTEVLVETAQRFFAPPAHPGGFRGGSVTHRHRQTTRRAR